MNKQLDIEPLKLALAPRSVAVIGASENPDKIGGRPLFYLAKHGFKGKVFAVNPKRTETQGFATFPAIDALPEAPDVAIVVVPGDAAVNAVRRCAAVGVKVCIVMASGFGETSTVEGKAAELDMVSTARSAGMRLLGPNAQGLANFGTGAILSFSSMYIESTPQDGPIGIVSQSGAMSVVPYGMLRARGIGVRHSHATGNDADVSVSELAAAVAQDPDLKLLMLYLESITDPAPLAEAARLARDRGLPIIALKSGRSAAGQKAAKSHTGALANEDRVVDAFFEQHGIWRANDVREMVNSAELYLQGWKPKGKRLVVLSNSGAICVMGADAATRVGMPLAQLSKETQSEIGRALPAFATSTNPIDLTAALMTNSRLFSEVLPIIARDPAADAMLVGIPVAGAAYDVNAFATDTADFMKRTGLPTVAAIPQAQVAAPFKGLGIPVFETETDAINALSQVLSHHERIAIARGGTQPRPIASLSTRMLNEAESLAHAHAAGIRVVDHRLCHSPDEAAAALVALGGDVAIKGCSRDVAHKSELGLVRLNVKDATTARSAYMEMRRALESRGMRFDGVLVCEMVNGLREMMIGAHRDPVFGRVVVFGDGGKYVEAMPDTALLIPPFGAKDVQRAMQKLRVNALFSGTRGESPMDSEAFVAAVVAVGEWVTGPASHIESLDLNPIAVRSIGGGCVVLDAVIFEGIPVG